MEEPCIRVEKLTKSFAGRTVVDDLSFSVRKGEVFALLGHNGAGKSTTIDLILGLKSPDSGCAQILASMPQKTERRYLNRSACSFSIPNTKALLRWKRRALNMPPWDAMITLSSRQSH